MLGAVAWAVRRGEKNPSAKDLDTPPPLVHESVRVDKNGLPSLGFIVAGFHNQLVFSRTMRDGSVQVAVDDFVPQHDDIVTIIGPQGVVEEAVTMIGHKSGIHLALDRSELDFRRVAVTNGDVAGRTIEDLNLAGRFGAVATRVRRGNVDMLAADDLVLQLGDRVRVTASSTRMPDVAKFLGDSERETGEVNAVGFATGMTLGLLLGLVSFPLGNSTFTFGDALGPLIVGLILGRVQRTGPIVWSVPYPAAEALRNFGMLAFLAYAGSHSGHALVDAFKSNNWYKVMILGLLIVVTSALIQEVLGRGLLKTSGAQMAGTLAGSETQPAVLAYATDRAGGDARVALGYALVYPVAMVLKVVLAPLIVTLF
jgi:putative transport protein